MMSDLNAELKRKDDYYRNANQNSGLWSCCGYDGLALVFEVPLDAVRLLPECEKRHLMGLLNHLAGPEGDAARRQMETLGGLSAEDRMAGILRMSARFAS